MLRSPLALIAVIALWRAVLLLLSTALTLILLVSTKYLNTPAGVESIN